MVKKHFNKLNIPTQWEQYWSKYPNGYSIMEALIDWVSQVDDMVDTQNDLSDTVSDYRKDLDGFIGRFDGRLQEEVTDLLKDWQDTGFLDVVINEALDTKYHEMDNRLTTQLQQISRFVIDVRFFGADEEKEDNSQSFNDAIAFCISNGYELAVRGKYKITDTIVVNGNVALKGYGEAEITNNAALKNTITVTSGALSLTGFTFIESVYNDLSTIEVKNGRLTAGNCIFKGKKVNGVLIKDKQKLSKIMDCEFHDYFYGICLQGATDIIISNNFFTGGSGVQGGNGVKLMNDNSGWLDPKFEVSKRILITNNIFYKCLADGIDGFTGATNVIISHNHFEDCKLLAIDLKTIYNEGAGLVSGTSIEGVRQGKNYIISNNTFKNFQTGVEVIRISNNENRAGFEISNGRGVQNVLIDNNIFENFDIGIYLLGAKNVNISNNIFDIINQRAISGIEHNDGVMINNNVFRVSVDSSTRTIISFALPTNQNIDVSGNILVGFIGTQNTNIGILLSGFNVTCSDNKLYNFQFAVQLDNTKKGFISKNIIENATNSALFFNGTIETLMIDTNLFTVCGRGINYGTPKNSNKIISNGNVYDRMTVAPTTNDINITQLSTMNETIWTN